MPVLQQAPDPGRSAAEDPVHRAAAARGRLGVVAELACLVDALSDGGDLEGELARVGAGRQLAALERDLGLATQDAVPDVHGPCDRVAHEAGRPSNSADDPAGTFSMAAAVAGVAASIVEPGAALEI